MEVAEVEYELQYSESIVNCQSNTLRGHNAENSGGQVMMRQGMGSTSQWRVLLEGA